MPIYFKEQDIQHLVTRTHAQFAERMISTFKLALYTRIENDKNKENNQWTDFVPEIVLTYEYKLKHDSNGFTPDEARQNQNSVDVKLNLEMKAKRNRTYPDLDVDDNVKIYKKQIN